MGRGVKTGGRDIKKGQVLNPLGARAHDQTLKKARALNKLEFERILNKYLYESKGDIKKLLKKDSLPAIDALVLKIIDKGISGGDVRNLAFLLERAIGKVPNNVNVTTSSHRSIMDIIKEQQSDV